MTEVTSGDLNDGLIVSVDMRQVLPAEDLRELTAAVEHVLSEVQATGADVGRQAMFVAHYLAPRLAEQRHDLADAQLRVEQAGVALSGSVADAARYEQMAHAQWEVAQRLRGEWAVASVDAERFRSLTEQRCPIGAHTGWFAPSNGVQHRCPWCQILKLGGYVGHVEHVHVDPDGVR